MDPAASFSAVLAKHRRLPHDEAQTTVPTAAELEALGDALDATVAYEYVNELLDRIHITFPPQRRLTNDGVAYFYWSASFPCRVVIKQDLDGHYEEVVGEATAFCWFPDDPDAPEPSLHAFDRGWEVALWSALEVVLDRGIAVIKYKDVRVPCEVEVRTDSGRLVRGMLDAFILEPSALRAADA
jgi:hypothetical protein